MFAAWPLLYAASFSGLYLGDVPAAGRRSSCGRWASPSAIKLPDPRWRNAWDWALLIGGAVPALLFGVAFGNLFLGLPFHFDALQRPVFAGGLLRPAASLCAAGRGRESVDARDARHRLCGAEGRASRCRTRAAALGRPAALVFVVAFIVAGVWVAGLDGAPDRLRRRSASAPSNPLNKQVALVPGAWLANYRAHALLWLIPLAALRRRRWPLGPCSRAAGPGAPFSPAPRPRPARS